jgi:rod shape-determining protein MreD
MSNFLSLPLLALAAALQVTLAPRISILGGTPDLVLLVVVAWSLNVALEQGILWAIVGGLCKDLLSAAPLGTSIIGMVLLLSVVSLVRQQLYAVGVFTLVWVILLGTVVQFVTTLVILFASGFQPAFADQLGYGVVFQEISYILLPTIVYNLIGIFPTYWVVRRLQRVGNRPGRLSS